ncbi:MAG: hypothetical protein CMP59_04750 [Flavobacteriales bacterium]|nr:hypothetical protein [Flavobacteriales bacterium]
MDEDFNTSSLPTAWTSKIISGNTNWSFSIDASTTDPGNNNIDGTSLAFFDDDALGASNTNNTVELLSPVFNNSNDSIILLEFDYNFRAFNGVSDSFLIDVFDGSQWQNVLIIASDDCGRWGSILCNAGFPHASINISAFKNTNCQIRFRYTDGNDWAWYVGIDNVSVFSIPNNDLSVIGIHSLSNSCSLNDSLRVLISNTGGLAQSNFSIAYKLNNSNVVSTTFSSVLNPGDSAWITFPTPLNFNPTTNSLNIFTDLTLDQDRSNDTLQISYYKSTPQALPLLEDFESNPNKWKISGNNPSWEIGKPNGTFLDTAFGGSKSLCTNLNGTYNSNELSYINSPCISLGSSTTDIRISFDLLYRLENNFDQLWLEYSIDNGNNWLKLEADSLIGTSNWYNQKTNQVFTGINLDSNFQKVSTAIRGLPQSSFIQFRFVLKSDFSSEFEGVAIDNLIISAIDSKDLSLNEIVYPSINQSCSLDSSYVFLELENLDDTPISSAKIYYQVNGGTILTDSLKDTLGAGIKRLFRFDKKFNFITSSSIQIRAWINTHGDSISLNDTTYKFIQNLSSTNNPLPFIEDFDAFPLYANLINGWNRSSNSWELRPSYFCTGNNSTNFFSM